MILKWQLVATGSISDSDWNVLTAEKIVDKSNTNAGMETLGYVITREKTYSKCI